MSDELLIAARSLFAKQSQDIGPQRRPIRVVIFGAMAAHYWRVNARDLQTIAKRWRSRLSSRCARSGQPSRFRSLHLAPTRACGFGLRRATLRSLRFFWSSQESVDT